MVILSLFSDFLQSVLSVVKSAKSVKSSKLIRVTKINKMFKAVKALRTVKIANFLSEGANIFIQLKVMISRTILCIPMIMRLIPIMFQIFYFWAIIGMENFNTKTHGREGRMESPYVEYVYASFNNFHGALLLLFQVSIEAKYGLSDAMFAAGRRSRTTWRTSSTTSTSRCSTSTSST